jgi:hypothetical protein
VSVQRWTERERALQALSRASVEASRCCLRGDQVGTARWGAAKADALAALDRLDPPRGRVVLQLEAFPDASPLFPMGASDGR